MQNHSIIHYALTGITALVAILHVYFLILESFLWTRPIGLKVFRQSLEKAKATDVLAKNQGLYNGFLAAGLIWSLLHANAYSATEIRTFFFSCVIIAGIVGGLTVNKRIFVIQSVPALIGLLLNCLVPTA